MSVFQQMVRQVYNADTYSLTGKIENIVGMSIEASGAHAALNETRSMTESEEAECRRRITAILETIQGGGAEYLEYLDEYIQDYQERYAGDGGSC